MREPKQAIQLLERAFVKTQDSEENTTLIRGSLPATRYRWRWGCWVILREALASTKIFQKGHPLFGRGIYSNLALFITPDGLVIQRQDNPVRTLKCLILDVAVNEVAYKLGVDENTTPNGRVQAVRVRRNELIKRLTTDPELAAPFVQERLGCVMPRVTSEKNTIVIYNIAAEAVHATIVQYSLEQIAMAQQNRIVPKSESVADRITQT